MLRHCMKGKGGSLQLMKYDHQHPTRTYYQTSYPKKGSTLEPSWKPIARIRVMFDWATSSERYSAALAVSAPGRGPTSFDDAPLHIQLTTGARTLQRTMA